MYSYHSMKKFIITTTEIQNGILHLALRPKKPEYRLRFYAGQYASIGFRLVDSYRLSAMRSFSIVSSPTDASKVEFGIKLGGDFTNSLASLPIGSEIFLRGPFGDFVIDSDYASFGSTYPQ